MNGESDVAIVNLDDGWGRGDACVSDMQVLDLKAEVKVTQNVQVDRVVGTLCEVEAGAGQVGNVDRRQVAQEGWNKVRAQRVEKTLENHQFCCFVLDEAV